MQKTAYSLFFFSLFFTLFCCTITLTSPRLTIVIVVDQLSYRLLQKAAPFLRKGIKECLTQGLIYHKAYMPHGLPTTAPGHTSLNTGTPPCTHGIIANKWWNELQQEVTVDTDTRYKSLSSAATPGKSPLHIQINGISDSFARTSTPTHPHYVYSLSGKSRAAVCTANKGGKAVWFEPEVGFTSSSYYFKTLPEWIDACNKKHNFTDRSRTLSWPSAFPLNSAPYRSVNKEGYAFTMPGAPLINSTHERQYRIEKHLQCKEKKGSKGAYQYIEVVPQMNEYLFDLASTCIQHHLTKKGNERMLLWICISAIDKIGHLMGPDAYEPLDIVYHLDAQLERFMKEIDRSVGLKNTLFVLTADHGGAPIPELAHTKGLLQAERVNKHTLIAELNAYLEQKYQIADACIDIAAANIYFDRKKIGSHRTAVLKGAKQFLKTKPYIKNAWTFYELAHLPVEKHSIESFFKHQLFANRSGDLIVQLQPNCLIDGHAKGTSHETPYEDDTHIPLILYQKGTIKKRSILSTVYATQLAPTLAHLLHVPGPDMTTEQILPGVEE